MEKIVKGNFLWSNGPNSKVIFKPAADGRWSLAEKKPQYSVAVDTYAIENGDSAIIVAKNIDQETTIIAQYEGRTRNEVKFMDEVEKVSKYYGAPVIEEEDLVYFEEDYLDKELHAFEQFIETCTHQQKLFNEDKSSLSGFGQLNMALEQGLIRISTYLKLHQLIRNPDLKYVFTRKVTFTDWNRECDLLIEYLQYRIQNRGKGAILLGNTLMHGYTCSEIMAIYHETGFLLDPPADMYCKELSFETWKMAFNKK